MAAGHQQKHLHYVLLQKREFISRGSHKHYKNTFSNRFNTRTVQIVKFPRNKLLFFSNQHNSSLARHVNAASRKSLQIQAESIRKARNHLERKFV